MDKTLSYILATRNKLPYLKGTLEDLITNKKFDEEILVADGDSNDGTKEYLQKLKDAGKIDYFLSEKDFGLAHALNKLCLKAKGQLIKYLSDDDAFDFDVIKTCKTFMLNHPEIDLINTEGGSLNNPYKAVTEKDPKQIVRALNYLCRFKQWKRDNKPFSFCDLGVMFRTSSLPIVSMWNPLFPGPDIEFSLRVSAGKSKLAWYAGYSYVNISNPKSISLTQMKKTANLKERLDKFYLDKNPENLVTQKLKILLNRLKGIGKPNSQKTTSNFEKQWSQLVQISKEWIRIKNSEIKNEFIS
jgi:glycosyltransferase involved in cell wall biosynthesis